MEIAGNEGGTRHQGRTAKGRLDIVASDTERARAFRKARRHSWLVKALRLALPLTAVACFALYGATLYATSHLKDNKISVGSVRIDPTNLTMETPRYSGFAKDGSEYRLRARSAVADLKMTGPVRLNAIDGDLIQPTGVITNLKAKWGTFDQKKDVLELYEKIDVLGSTGMKARLTRATVMTKDSRIISNEPVWAESTTGTIEARSMDVNSKTHKAAFNEDVRVTLKPNAAASKKPDQAEAEAAAKKPPPLPGLQANSGLPVVVTSMRLDVDDAAHTAYFRNAVVARQGDAALAAPELDVLYEGSNAEGGVKAQKKPTAMPGSPEDQTRLKFIRARGGVVMTNRDDRAESLTMDYDAKSEQITLAGKVVLTQPPDRKVMAEKALIDQKADTILLTGGVLVNQARNVFRSHRLAIDRKAGIARLASPAEPGRPAGRISTLLYQGAAPKPGASPKKTAPAEEGAALGLLGSGFKSDPNAPINVEAATLDIFDHKHAAVYVGKVVARQGDFVVNTEEMTARYSGETGIASGGPLKQEPKRKSAGGSDLGGAQLQRIEARKGVIVTGKDGQTATGEWANFDVKANTIVMGGKVEVIQKAAGAPGKTNKFRLPDGLVLVMDLTTGITRTEGGASNAGATLASTRSLPVAKPSGPQTSSAVASSVSSLVEAATAGTADCPKGAICRRGRMELILYPNQPEKSKVSIGGAPVTPDVTAKKKKPRNKDKKPANGVDGWSSSVEQSPPR